MTHINLLDEYPVQSFHFLLRAATNKSDNEDTLCEKARVLDSSKEKMSDFQSTSVMPRKQSLKRTDLSQLKLKAAEFIKNTLDDIRQYQNQAAQVQGPKGRQKPMT